MFQKIKKSAYYFCNQRKAHGEAGRQKVKDFVQDVSKVDVNADLSNPDRRYVVDAKSILGILSLDISHVMNLTIYDDEKNVGKYEKIFEKYGVKDNN